MPTARESLDSKYSMCDPKVNLLSITSPRYLASSTTSIGVELMAMVMLLGVLLTYKQHAGNFQLNRSTELLYTCSLYSVRPSVKI